STMGTGGGPEGAAARPWRSPAPCAASSVVVLTALACRFPAVGTNARAGGPPRRRSLEVGVTPAGAACDALVAQWIEHQPSKLMVAGSSPAGGASDEGASGPREDDGSRSAPARHERPPTAAPAGGAEEPATRRHGRTTGAGARPRGTSGRRRRRLPAALASAAPGRKQVGRASCRDSGRGTRADRQ